jgi:hypothetical protein
MEFDEVPAGGDGIGMARFLKQIPSAQLTRRQRFIGLRFRRRQFNRNVGLLEGRNLIVIGVLGIGFVLRAVNQVQVQAVGAFAHDNAFFG